jgi:PadR family transcriptional regulator, regulatory protein AphA
LGEDEFRSQFLLFARFAPELPVSLVETRIKERLASIDEATKELEALGQKHHHPADAWVISYGQTCMSAARDYMKQHMHELIALARPDAEPRQAAE